MAKKNTPAPVAPVLPTVEDSINMFRTTIEGLEGQISEKVDTLNALNAEITDKMNEINGLREQVTNLTNEIRPVQLQINSFKAALSQLENPQPEKPTGTRTYTKTSQGEVPAWLANLPEEFDADDIAKNTGMSRASLNTYLSRFAADGKFVERIKKGRYRLLPAAPATTQA